MIVSNKQQGLTKYPFCFPYGFSGGIYYVKTSLDF